MEKYVAYYRVSTAKQGISGLGLEAQQAAVEAYVKRETGTLIAPPFVEVESGKKSDRPQLRRAIAYAKVSKATLLVAKLDRLARNVSFVANLLDSGVDFRAIDNPHANRLTILILAAIAEEEGRAISARTKAALAAAKARGTKLGSARDGHWDGREDRRAAGQRNAIKKAAEIKTANRLAEVREVAPELLELRDAGLSYREIAKKLNDRGSLAPSGAAWGPISVYRVISLGSKIVTK